MCVFKISQEIVKLFADKRIGGRLEVVSQRQRS